MIEKYTQEQKDQMIEWFTNHGFTVYVGGCGCRTVESDGFLWYSLDLVKRNYDGGEDEVILSITHEVYSQEDEDFYWDELRFEYDAVTVSEFVWYVDLEEDMDELWKYMQTH